MVAQVASTTTDLAQIAVVAVITTSIVLPQLRANHVARFTVGLIAALAVSLFPIRVFVSIHRLYTPSIDAATLTRHRFTNLPFFVEHDFCVAVVGSHLSPAECEEEEHHYRRQC